MKNKYDLMYLDKEKYAGPANVFNAAAKWLPKLYVFSIVEIGCGIGEFAQVLFDLEKVRQKTDEYQQELFSSYTGYDVSGVAIDRAKARGLDKRFKFQVADAEKVSFELADVYVCFQTMEHLSLPNGDFDVISRIPENKPFVFSVPLNSLGKYHLREYKGFEHICKKYRDVLDCHESIIFKDGKHKRILVRSTKR